MNDGDEKQIRIVLADDHPLIRAGIAAAFANESDMILVDEASNGQDAQTICLQKEVDVLILDLSMPGPTARETVERLRRERPAMAILILTAFDDASYIRALVSLGVTGYILKDEATEVIVDAVRTVVHGGRCFSQRVVDKMLTSYANPASQPRLGQKELKVLQLLKDGCTTHEVAEQLSINERTIRYYVENILQKLDAKNRIEAVATAISMHLIE